MFFVINAFAFFFRRARVQFSSLNEPFSNERFHFGKINSNEILFTLKPAHRPDSSATAIANVSPIEWGHFLLVPNMQQNLMQKITRGTPEVVL